MDLTIEQRRARDGCCLACGESLPEDAGPRRTYCDRRCQRAFYRGDVVREQGTCVRCGRALPAGSPLRRYCRQVCRQRAYVERHAARRFCRHCASEITMRAPQARYCSDACRFRAAGRRRYGPQRVAS